MNPGRGAINIKIPYCVYDLYGTRAIFRIADKNKRRSRSWRPNRPTRRDSALLQITIFGTHFFSKIIDK
jgi:hypothetical protein